MKKLTNRTLGTAATLALTLATSVTFAGSNSRIRLINTAPYSQSYVSLAVDDKKIANLVPQGETRKFKKVAADGTYTLHIFDGLLEAAAVHLTTWPTIDYSILPYLNNGKPDALIVAMAPADKKDSMNGSTKVVSAASDATSLMAVYVDNKFAGACGPNTATYIQSLAEGNHTFTLRDTLLFTTIATANLYIQGGSNNIVALSGTLNPQDESALVLHAYNDKSKF